MKCLSCNSENIEQAKNDDGFIKSKSLRPVRVYKHICLDCGFIMSKAEVNKDADRA